MRVYFFIIFLCFFCGCSSLNESVDGPHIRLSSLNRSVESVLKAFEFGVPGNKIRGRSKNGRVIVSTYHPYRGSAYESGLNSKIRAFVKMAILGERRPYDLKVQFIVEKRLPNDTYEIVRYDNRRARDVAKKMKEYLAARPDSSDVIDDFRAF